MSLLIEIDRYRRLTGMAETRVGRLAVRDPRLVHDLRRGRQPGPAMTRRVLAWLATAPRPGAGQP